MRPSPTSVPDVALALLKFAVVVLLSVVCIVVFLVLTTPVKAADAPSVYVFTLPTGDSMRFFPGEACTNPKVLEQIKKKAEVAPEVGQLDYRAGEMTWQGQGLAFCFAPIPNMDGIFIVDETGDAGSMPTQGIVPASHI